MPFCNWCQLESQGEDVCEWCKRPVARFKYSGFDFIREIEPAGDRVVPIVASFVLICFLALLGYAAFANKPPATQTKLQPIGEMSGSSNPAGASGPSAPAVAALKSAPPAPTAAVERLVYRPAAQPLPAKANPAQAAPAEGWDNTDVVPLILEKVKLSISKDASGAIVCHGTLTITLHSNKELSNIRVLFQSEAGPMVFRAFTGAPEDPEFREIVALDPGITQLRIIAVDAELNVLRASLKRITVSGRLGTEDISSSVAVGD